MPGCGKSTVGRRLAQKLGLDFIDTDQVLLERTGKTTGQLTATVDRATFMKEETDAVCSVWVDRPTIIATGGSVVYSDKAMRHLKRMGTVIYIDVPLHMLQRRLGDLNARGVVLRKGQTLESLYRERGRLYRRYADIIFTPRRLRPAGSASMLAVIVRFFQHPEGNGSIERKHNERV